ncbi:MAG: di-trans,poly-cis-decaprenylcistransferase [Candidatus Methanosuratus sp.]|nr:di-trans,poly-cis-decaprenylcistransferase [Candidatus Methanosuratincola sp.]
MRSNLVNSIRGWVLSWVYKYYEKKLSNSVKNGQIPRHVGLILDGNRRWAMELGLDPSQGHHYGFEKLKEVLQWCWEIGIKTVTVYALSTENLNRPREEVEALIGLAEKAFNEVITSKEIHERKVKIRALGRLYLLNESLREAIKKAEESTKDYNDRRLNIAIAYGGRAEILDAAKKILADAINGDLEVNEINEEAFARYLYTAEDPDPDLIIRTSGEERLSGFLLWQSAYSEFYFMDVYWPEIRKIDLLRAIRTYQRRKRRFGA